MRLPPWMPNKHHLTPYLFLLPAIIILGFAVFLPSLQAFFFSFTRYDLIQPFEWIGLDNFQRLWRDDIFQKVLINTLLYLITVVPILVFLPLGLAILVNRKIRGVNWFRMLFYTPVVISMVVAGIAWKSLYTSNGLFNQLCKQIYDLLIGFHRQWQGSLLYRFSVELFAIAIRILIGLTIVALAIAVFLMIIREIILFFSHLCQGLPQFLDYLFNDFIRNLIAITVLSLLGIAISRLEPLAVTLFLASKTGIPWLTDPQFSLWSVMAVTVWKGLGYYMVIYLAGLQAIDPELYEAAAIDGSQGWLKHWQITLPLMRPYLILVAVISAVAATKVFEEVYIMTQGGPLNSSKTVVYYLYEQAFENLEIGYGCAIGLVLFLGILGLSLLNLYWSQGRNSYPNLSR